MTNQLTALFGGTFDPIHYGHLLPAEALAKEIQISHISLLPNHIPPHKPQPEASTNQRIQMLKLAIDDSSCFSIDLSEITKNQVDRPSYTIDTLKKWREIYGKERGLAFIIGQDSLLSLPTWHGWQTLLDYCHLLVCRRPGYAQTSNNPELTQWIAEHKTTDIQKLHQYPNGYIYFAHTPLEDISATEIRSRVNKNQDCSDLLPYKVWQYIQSEHLYGA